MSIAIDRVQLRYATMLAWLVRVGLVFMFTAFALYAASIVPSSVRLEQVPQYWHLSANEFATAASAEVESGWGWLRDLGDSRTLAFASLVLFPSGTMLLAAVAIILYLRDRTPIYAAIAALETIVLVVAATGLVAGGG